MYPVSKAQRGFTVIELMMTIMVLGILLGLAVPSFMETIRNNRLIAHNNEFIGALNIARSEALKRSDSVSICASADQLTCTGANDWGTGWILFTDPNANGTFEAPDELLQTWAAGPPDLTLNATTRSFVRFGASGTSASGLETFDLIRDDCVGMKARRISISMVGRISTAKVACP
jgi:type IV fimbrial biogenesis protein FimT